MSEGVGSGYQGLVEVKKALSHKRHGRCLGHDQGWLCGDVKGEHGPC